MTKLSSKSSQKPTVRPKKNRVSKTKKTTTEKNDASHGHAASQLGGVVSHKNSGLHWRNLHRDGYDFDKLIEASSELMPYVRPNPYGNLSIDFADPQAVKALNTALLKRYYQIAVWDIPTGFLCPPIPGRVDYLHYAADLLAGIEVVGSDSNGYKSEAPRINTLKSTFKKMKIQALDIGTGANAIYPLLGIQAYGWRFVASDIDPVSLANVKTIVEANICLQGKLNSRLQANPQHVFQGVIKATDRFDITLCNPPFHSSLAEANAGSQRKVKNLTANKAVKGHKILAASRVSSESIRGSTHTALNFGGQKAELWCNGGEKKFLNNMIRESKSFATQCMWFTSLVSKKENIKSCYAALEKVGAITIKTIDMAQGNKLTRVLVWSFLTAEQRQLWAKYRG